MTYWKEWGVYLTCLVESGGNFGDQPSFNRVENDFLTGTSANGWGGGLGLIQFTSNAFQLMQRIIQLGASTSPIAGSQYLSDLQNNSNAAYYNQSWINMPNMVGPFTDWNLVTGIKTMLDSSQGHQAQSEYMKVYIDQTNGQYTNAISGSGLSDEVKAFLINVVVLAPGIIPVLLSPPVSTTVQGMGSDEISSLGSGYTDRVNTMIGFFGNNIDFSNPPPWNYTDGSGSAPTASQADGKGVSAKTTPSSQPNSGTSISKTKTIIKDEPEGTLIFNRGSLSYQLGTNKTQIINKQMQLTHKIVEVKQNVSTAPQASNPTTKDTDNPEKGQNPPNPTPPSAGNIDISPLLAQIGNTVGSGQCYALAQWWVSHLGGDGSAMVGHMSASSIWSDYSWGSGSFAGFTSGAGKPSDGWQVGDIVCWGAYGGNPYGHVGVVAEVVSGVGHAVNQNVAPVYTVDWLYTDGGGNITKLDIDGDLSAYWVGAVTGYVRKT